MNAESIKEWNLDTSVNLLRDVCHSASREAGWWEPSEEFASMGEDAGADPAYVAAYWRRLQRPVKIALVHSEASEMLEGERKQIPDDHLPDRPMNEVEAADLIIRIMDYCGEQNLDVGGALVDKMIYNASRADHKPEARAANGGKQF